MAGPRQSCACVPSHQHSPSSMLAVERTACALLLQHSPRRAYISPSFTGGVRIQSDSMLLSLVLSTLLVLLCRSSVQTSPCTGAIHQTSITPCNPPRVSVIVMGQSYAIPSSSPGRLWHLSSERCHDQQTMISTP